MKSIKERLQEAHEVENGYNVEMGEINKQIESLRRRKQKLSNLVSKNMKYRNRLIEEM